MLTWKNSATAKKKNMFFLGGVWFFLHTLSPTGMLQQPTKYPTFLAILRTRRSFAATLWPWLLFGSTFSSQQKDIEKIMPCDLKGGDSFNIFQVPMCSCYAMTHEILKNILTFADVKKKKRFKRIKLWLTISLSSRVLKKDPVSRN